MSTEKKGTPTRRISKRKYQGKMCQKIDCKNLFTPTDSRQKYCCAQHRVDHNNDCRKSNNKGSHDLHKILTLNETILKKIYYSNANATMMGVNKQLLDYEKYQFDYNTDAKINTDNNNRVLWTYHFGLETKDPGVFVIRYRHNLPFDDTSI